MRVEMRKPTDISIHALRGEGDVAYPSSVMLTCISIHALRGEGDLSLSKPRFPPKFLSTPSVGRATLLAGVLAVVDDISIHALRGEGDLPLQ